MERLVPTLAELAPLLRLLASSATGERLTTYTTLITGPRRRDEADGPEELHVVVIDNGRSALRGTVYEEMLNCIRCGACLNVCPVYRKTGGTAYSDVYSGPMGAVLVPLLSGLEREAALPHASSLCGACTEACPVGIPLHELLLELRRDLVDEGQAVAAAAGVELWEDPWEMNVLATQRGHRHSPSMLEDVKAHRPTEVDLITGSLVREANRLGVPVPLHETMYRLIKAKEASWE